MACFVTGATGFIGRYLVRELLARDDPEDREIFILFREASSSKLEALRTWWGPEAYRVTAIEGDLEALALGVSEPDCTKLRGHVRHFFHLAAIYDLGATSEALATANVSGTRHALELARIISAGCFHLVSSIASAGLYPGVFTEDMFEEAVGLDHPYFRTKHESEGLVRQQTHMPWRVYRPGMANALERVRQVLIGKLADIFRRDDVGNHIRLALDRRSLLQTHAEAADDNLLQRCLFGLLLRRSGGRHGSCGGYERPYQQARTKTPLGIHRLPHRQFVGRALSLAHASDDDFLQAALGIFLCQSRHIGEGSPNKRSEEHRTRGTATGCVHESPGIAIVCSSGASGALGVTTRYLGEPRMLLLYWSMRFTNEWRTPHSISRFVLALRPTHDIRSLRFWASISPVWLKPLHSSRPPMRPARAQVSEAHHATS